MTEFIQGESRSQATLFPERLDDYVSEESAVRVIDVFIDELDLSGLGFRTQPQDTGRPAYHIRQVCRQFVLVCRNLNLFANAWVAIDGSKFKAVNNTYRNFTRAKMKRRLAQVDATIERYLQQLAEADRQEVAEEKTPRLEDKIAALKKEMVRLKEVEARRLKAPGKQISLTDPDARSMNHRGSALVGYNVQAAVDTDHHLIVAHEVSNVGNDRRQLAKMAKQAKSDLEVEELRVVADRGYYRSEEIQACEQAGITAYVPKPQTSGNRAKGQFGRDAFRYVAEDDEYECPAGERLVWHMNAQDKGRTLRVYWTYKCRSCPIRAQCTSGVYRKMSRWEHEEVLDRAQVRLAAHPEAMRARRATVEHPFGTLKAWMGSTHFLTKTLERVNTEMSLHVLAYNLRRMMNLVGTKPLIEAIRA